MTAEIVSDSLIATLPGHTYVDDDVFRAEQERIFEQMWFCAVRSADLDKAGAYRTVQIGRESVIVTRNRKGAFRAYYNICRHRGVKLCMEESGEAARSFQCPYHAWTYDFDGKLIAAPNLTKMPDIDRQKYGLVGVPVREYMGYVWLCLADEPPSFDDDVVGAIEDRLGDAGAIAGYDIANLSLGRRISYDVKANWKLIIENFMECYHCATIHPELTEVLPEFADGLAAQYFVGHGAEFGADIQGFTVDGSEGLERIPGISEDQDRRYYAITIKPTVFVNLVPDHVIIHRMFPLAADRTVVECDWLYMPSVVEAGRDLTASVELFHRVNQQDFDACERCQPAMSSKIYAKGGVLVPSEHHISAFHEWVTARLTEPAVVVN
ncbi:SRPBCC family protein [Arthrobacter sp.]|uniref:aromatic ring-hydroxylating oxygenase subunit alpha n=1 Tax=Arthrobacter sp. TaxID=1667 RepID=UPI003399C7F9